MSNVFSEGVEWITVYLLIWQHTILSLECVCVCLGNRVRHYDPRLQGLLFHHLLAIYRHLQHSNK